MRLAGRQLTSAASIKCPAHARLVIGRHACLIFDRPPNLVNSHRETCSTWYFDLLLAGNGSVDRKEGLKLEFGSHGTRGEGIAHDHKVGIGEIAPRLIRHTLTSKTVNRFLKKKI